MSYPGFLSDLKKGVNSFELQNGYQSFKNLNKWCLIIVNMARELMRFVE
jgi:hypothetical protein